VVVRLTVALFTLAAAVLPAPVGAKAPDKIPKKARSRDIIRDVMP
jgi:hypothetical protein